MFGDSTRDIGALYRRLGLPARGFEPPTPPSLMLQATARAFEYPLRDHPPQLHFIGPLVPPTPPGLHLPGWWADVTGADRPVVVVTQGTLATDPCDLIVPTLHGLADEDVLVVAAGVRDLASLGALPANARTAPFIPFPALLPHAHVYVSNGGYGGVQQALLHDLPVVVAGTTEDKVEVARRVQVAGVGVRLGTRTPRREQLRSAVRRLLGDPAPRLAAARLGAGLRAHDAPREAADLLEALIRTGAPVVAAPG